MYRFLDGIRPRAYSSERILPQKNPKIVKNFHHSLGLWTRVCEVNGDKVELVPPRNAMEVRWFSGLQGDPKPRWTARGGGGIFSGKLMTMTAQILLPPVPRC